MKIIIHVDEMAKWKMVLSNLKHLNEFYNQADDEIEVLVNGDAVNGVLKDCELASDILTAFVSQNTLAVCQNSLDQRQIKPEQLLAGANVVPAGVVELVEKQAAGFRYLRP
jgi:intracellular sulfur oxidation DsrE/DsrF family protein